jgi:hypothetical protein
MSDLGIGQKAPSPSSARKHAKKSSDSPAKKWELLRPVTDVRISFGSERLPAGFTHCKHLGEQNSANSRGGLRLLVERAKNKLPVTQLAVIFPAKGESPPPGFQIVKGMSDLNNSSSASSRLCLCWGDGPPLVDVALASTWPVPRWRTLDASPLGHKLHLSAKRGNSGLAICLRYDLRDFRLLETVKGLGGEFGLPEALDGPLDEEDDGAQDQAILRTRSLVRLNPAGGHGGSRASSSDGDDDSGSSVGGARPRKGSVIGQAFASALPLGRNLLARVAAQSGGGGSGPARRDSLPDASPALAAEDAGDSDARARQFQTRLQRASLKAQKRGEGLGVLFCDPEVVSLLAPSPDVLRRVIALLLACYDGSGQDAAWALDAVAGIVEDGVIAFAAKPALQMNLFDFCMTAAADAAESGQACVVAAAVRLAVKGARASPAGLHLISLHHVMSALCTGHDFFSRLREDAFAPPAAAAALASGSTSSVATANTAGGALSAYEAPDTPPRALSSMFGGLSRGGGRVRLTLAQATPRRGP